MEKITKSLIVPDFSQKNIQSDLIHFKDDILKDFRSIKISFNDKHSILEENLNKKLNKFELTIKSFEQKILELSKLITIDKTLKEKVEALNAFKEESSDSIFKQRAKLNEFESRINKEIDRINNILSDSVIYTGIIGGNSKFKTFHDFIDFVLREIGEIALIKDKNGMDLRPFKKKIEQTVDAFRIQLNNIFTKEMTNNAINQSEERMQNSLKLFDEKIKSIKVENYSTNLNNANKLEELNTRLINLEKFQKNLELNSEILYIKKEINTIYEILRDLFSAPEVKKEVEKKAKIYSGVKQYINGKLNADQLTSMKKFSYNKNDSNGKTMEKNNSTKISPFPSPEKVKIKNSFDRKKLFNNSESRNNDDLGYNTHLISSSNTEKIFISQKGFLINKTNSKEFEDIEKLINEKSQNEDNKNYMNNKEKNNSFEKINLDNRIQKVFKEEEPINKFSNFKNYEKKNSRNKLDKNGNLQQCIISEEEENILSDNTNMIKEKLNRTKNNKLYINTQNNSKNISLEVFSQNKAVTTNPKNKISYLKTNTTENDSVSNISKQIDIDKYNQKKINLNKLKLLKEKEYNQSVPIIDIKKEKEKVKEGKIKNKENSGTQSNESRFTKKTNLFGNKTYSSFPRIIKEMVTEKKPDENYNLEKKLIKIIADNNSYELNDENIQYNYYFKKKPKKVLLINPDSIPNFELRKNNKSANRRKSSIKPNNGFRTQKNIDKMVNEMMKGLIVKKKNKVISNGGNIQTYNSLYDIISAHEHMLEQKKIAKNKK